MKKISPNFMTDDVRQTIVFYRDYLDFEVSMAVSKDKELVKDLTGDEELVWASLKNGAVELMFQARENLVVDVPVFEEIETIGASVSFYMEVEEVDSWYEKIRENTEIVKELHTTWYGMREFYFKDNNGYILTLAARP